MTIKSVKRPRSVSKKAALRFNRSLGRNRLTFDIECDSTATSFKKSFTPLGSSSDETNSIVKFPYWSFFPPELAYGLELRQLLFRLRLFLKGVSVFSKEER